MSRRRTHVREPVVQEQRRGGLVGAERVEHLPHVEKSKINKSVRGRVRVGLGSALRLGAGAGLGLGFWLGLGLG